MAAQLHRTGRVRKFSRRESDDSSGKDVYETASSVSSSKPHTDDLVNRVNKTNMLSVTAFAVMVITVQSDHHHT